MTTRTTPGAIRSALRAVPAPVTGRRILAVDAGRHGAALTSRYGDLVIHTLYRHIGRAMLSEVRPNLVVAPLITPAWDLLDLAQQLRAAGYRGEIQALSQQLPRMDLIEAEFSDLFPELRLCFSVLNG